MLAQIATAATGVVDTLAVGGFGTATDLAAVAVGAVLFNVAYWAFGFLRMATTGLTAQAMGAGDEPQASAVLLRAAALGLGLGVSLWMVVPLLGPSALEWLGAEPAVHTESTSYVLARVLGAPASLMGFAISGWLLGRGRTGALLLFQGVLNGVNAGLDALLVTQFGLGAMGVGLGTAVADWAALFVGLLLVRRGLRDWAPLWDPPRLWSLFAANRDILLRTMALVASFAWFVRAGARIDTATVAGNQVLMQFIAVSAFVLDAFAFLTEKEAGEAVGAGDVRRLGVVLRQTTHLAVAGGVLFSVVYWVAGGWLLQRVIADPAARSVALTYLPYCALVPLIGVPAWQLDGLFLGATRGRALRNAAIAATVAYVALDVALRPFGATGLWVAFLASYGFRALGLAVYVPGLFRELRTAKVLEKT